MAWSRRSAAADEAPDNPPGWVRRSGHCASAVADADHDHAAYAALGPATVGPGGDTATGGSDPGSAAGDAPGCATVSTTDLGAAGHRTVAGARQGECAECAADGKGRAGGA